MKIANYVRVSTGDQTTATQEADIARYCEYKQWSVTVFKDHNVSGSKTSRPEFDRMMEAVRAGEFDAVLVWRFDRASRSTGHLLTLLEEFDRLGVQFISLREQIDTATPTGRLMFTMVAAFAQFERDVIAERTSAAMQRAKGEGRKISRDRTVDYEAVTAMFDRGYSAQCVADEFKISAAHVRRIVRNQKKEVSA